MMFASERDHGEAVKIINLVQPSTLVRFPMQGVSVCGHLMGCLSTLRSDLTLTDAEYEDFNICLRILRSGVAASSHY